MAYPAFSPTGGVGTVYTDPQSGITYKFLGGSNWQQISSGGDTSQQTQTPPDVTQDPTYQALLDQINKIQTAQPPASAPSPITVDTTPMKVPTMQEFETQVANNPDIMAYYNKLIANAKGDLAEATRQLEYDYSTGVRIAGEDYTKTTTNATQDLAAALKSLGITFTGETNTLTDTLNKRGIATTQGAPGVDNKQPLNVGTEGQSGTEFSQLKSDQALRQEAVQRTADRTVAAAGLTKSRAVDTATEQAKSGQYGAQSTEAKALDTAYQENQQTIEQRAALLQNASESAASQKTAQQGIDLQKAALNR